MVGVDVFACYLELQLLCDGLTFFLSEKNSETLLCLGEIVIETALKLALESIFLYLFDTL